MFCRRCGSEVTEGLRFCQSCGAPTTDAPAPMPAPQYQEQPPGKSGSGFLRSGAGIALVVILAVAVIGGITIGLVFAFKGSGSNEAELARVWEEYEVIVDEADREQADNELTAAALAKNQEELKKTRKKVDALEEALARTKVAADSVWKEKYDQLAGSIRYYDRYVRKLEGLYVTLADALAANTLNTQLTAIQSALNELTALATQAKDLAEAFLENNTAVTAGATFDPAIFDKPTAIATEVDDATGGDVTVSDSDTGADIDQDSGDAVAGVQADFEWVLSRFAGGSWPAITGDMTPALLSAYQNAPIPWEQVSYRVLSEEVQFGTVDGDTATFTVVEERDDFGELFEATTEWHLVKTGSAWKVNDVIEDGYSKLQ
ncbi:MAG: hypothetical protein KKF41_03975 [Actinobacteria bacterium]|nr:hypothetical protein [Actinomycetota bacterium]MBU1944125.1 hypothetical protein [Actinomycetota bacterium]MBU2686724.1 hypothetical protein [Actinomycetota bacterium]